MPGFSTTAQASDRLRRLYNDQTGRGGSFRHCASLPPLALSTYVRCWFPVPSVVSQTWEELHSHTKPWLSGTCMSKVGIQKDWGAQQMRGFNCQRPQDPS